MRIFIFIVFLTALANTAAAGAWLKEKGTGLVSLSFGATAFSETTNGLYFEYGLTDATTVGLDISAFTNSQGVRNGFGNVFLRRRLGSTNGPHRFSYEVGVGGFWGNEMQLPAVRTALSWGRGFQLSDRNGWINVDVAYIYEPYFGTHTTKLDGTLGLALGPVVTGIFEVNLFRQDDDTFGAIEPALLLRPEMIPFDIKIGAQVPVDDADKTALKLGVWYSF